MVFAPKLRPLAAYAYPTMWRVRRPLYIRLVGARTLARCRCALRDAPQARHSHIGKANDHLVTTRLTH